PISAVDMYTDYLIEELKDLAEEPKSFLLNTKTLISEVLTMLSELLDLYSFESGRVEIHPADVELRRFLEPIIAQMNLLFNQKKIRYQLNLDDAPESWVFDRKRIAQVLENLLTNAAKFSQPDSGVVVNVSKEDGFLQIAVQDIGQGIPKEELLKIFQKFQKGYAKPTAGESSTGLGLAIAKQIVEQHQGRIQVTSQMGEGSTFTIILPSTIQEINHEREMLQAAYATP
ncbi:HAMP domain-containing histidine kinase, partial [bacterium]|nr:HAMP domain-containing histidine kinase [bacterium]